MTTRTDEHTDEEVTDEEVEDEEVENEDDETTPDEDGGALSEDGEGGGDEPTVAKLQAEIEELKPFKKEVAKYRRRMRRAERRAEEAEQRAEQLMTRTAESTVRAAAAGKLNDPEDAIVFLDASDYVDADDEEIAAAIDELVERKPHLAASSSPKPRPRLGPQGEDDNDDEPSAVDSWIRNAVRGE